jgi:uncharacterized protein (DUF3820 family)
MEINFGKYKGQQLDVVPRQYLEWGLKNDIFKGDLKIAVLNKLGKTLENVDATDLAAYFRKQGIAEKIEADAKKVPADFPQKAKQYYKSETFNPADYFKD